MRGWKRNLHLMYWKNERGEGIQMRGDMSRLEGTRQDEGDVLSMKCKHVF